MTDSALHPISALINEIAGKIADLMDDALKQCESNDDARALMFGVMAKELVIMVNSLSLPEAPHPLFKAMSFDHRIVATAMMVGMLAAPKGDPADFDIVPLLDELCHGFILVQG